MGSWRKVGAFLGLVPDDSHPYDERSYEEAGYPPAGYDGGYENQDRAHPGGSYGRDEAAPAGDEADRYGDADQGDRRSDGTDAGRSAPHSARSPRRSFSTDPVTQGANAMKADQRRDADSSTASRPASVKLTGFGEARIVGEKYRDGQSVILDMTGMSDADARRLVDFSAGLAFSLRGSIEKVAPKVFMLLPAEADIAGGSATALEDARAYVGGYAGR